MEYTNSPLVTYTNISSKKNKNRNHIIDTITIHCFVGQVTAKRGCDYFATTDRDCSANYVVGYDGSIGLSVDEKDRSWCTSSSSNDHRAITIEVASDTKHPYAVTDEAYNALIQLITDICKRNNIKKLLWKADKTLIGKAEQQNMTVHRWFANKACPGEYLYGRHYDIADKVNKLLNAEEKEEEKVEEIGYPKLPFLIDVHTSMSIYKKPSADAVSNSKTGVGTFTITEMNGNYGKLKSGAGWLWLASNAYSFNNKCEWENNMAPLEVEVDLSKHNCIVLNLVN